ncbi:MAG TPA: 50S ribosomal protein L4 [Vicinamibacterales bacterium]|nr:50S ribosomal protein L4 [Vicinamibacterales bacterium]
MTLDVVNGENQKVGSVDLGETVFSGPIKRDLIWESVVRQNASERRGTHKAKNRALVSGGGKKPYKQKGTGRAQAGSTRSPLWRHGGTVFPPQPRSYDYDLPKKVERGALKAAIMAKLQDNAIIVVDELKAAEKKTKATAALLKRLGATSRTLVVDARLDDNFLVSARNIAGVTLVASGRLTARDVMNTTRIIATRAAIERLQEVLG